MGGGVFVGALSPAEMPKPCRASRLKKNGENAPRSVRGRKRSAARRSGDARRLYPAPVRRWPCSSRSGRAWPYAACSALLIGPARHARSAPRVTALARPAQGRPWHVGRYDDDPPGDRGLRHALGPAVHGRPFSPCRSAGADCGRFCLPAGHQHPGLQRRLPYWLCQRLPVLGVSPGEVAPGAARGLAGPVACPSATGHAVPGEASSGAGLSGQTGLGAVIAAAWPLWC